MIRKRRKHILRNILSWKWLPMLLWLMVLLPSFIFLFRYWYMPVKNLGETFLVQVLAIILAAFITWLIWERSRAMRAREEEAAASKGREFLFLQARGLISDIWGQIFKKLIGDYPPCGEAYEADTMTNPPTMRNRLLTYQPSEIFRRGEELQHEAMSYYERASTLRWLAYSQAVQLRLRQFLGDWDKFMIEWNQLLRELEYPLTSKPQEGVLRIDMFVQNVFERFIELSKKLESENYR